MQVFAQLQGLKLLTIDVHPGVSIGELRQRVLSLLRSSNLLTKSHQAEGSSRSLSHILFIDECNCSLATEFVRSLVIDRWVGQHRVSPSVWIMAACNPTKEEGAAAMYTVYPLPKSLCTGLWSLGSTCAPELVGMCVTQLERWVAATSPELSFNNELIWAGASFKSFFQKLGFHNTSYVFSLRMSCDT